MNCNFALFFLSACLDHFVYTFEQCCGSGRVFLGLPDPDPDPLVKAMDPDPDPAVDPDPSLIMQK
jgi:hypothetical protein